MTTEDEEDKDMRFRRFYAAKDEFQAQLAKSREFALTLADVMLSLTLEHISDSKAVLCLKKRGRPIYTHIGGKQVDIAEYSGIVVPERQDLTIMTKYSDTKNPGLVPWNDDFAVEHDVLVGAVERLFAEVIRDYEAQRIKYPDAFNGNGIDRNAHVSVTDLATLRGFNLRPLLSLPDTYHSYEGLASMHLRYSDSRDVIFGNSAIKIHTTEPDPKEKGGVVISLEDVFAMKVK